MYLRHAPTCPCEECVRIRGLWASEAISRELAEIKGLLVRALGLDGFDGAVKPHAGAVPDRGSTPRSSTNLTTE